MWILSLQKAATAFFLSKDVGVPWETRKELSKVGDKVSFTFFNPSYKEISEIEHIGRFSVRLVCTISTTGLYDLSSLSGKVSKLLKDPIIDDDVCIEPSEQEIEIQYFDFEHGYKQSLMEQTYTARMRG